MTLLALIVGLSSFVMVGFSSLIVFSGVSWSLFVSGFGSLLVVVYLFDVMWQGMA
ncbi:hypothetical protein BC941DRAFT_416146 [Chlamydoabsidia padenii]|nr:hypothetical protein BC941DRAFT_416146 [Chlamydoabsidia padenii]